MKQKLVGLSFDTNSLLSILSEILKDSLPERDILIPIKAQEIVGINQFDSRYHQLDIGTKIL